MPNALENVYPGSGVCAQTAEIKIHLKYDLHSGEFLNFQVGPGKNNEYSVIWEIIDCETTDESSACTWDEPIKIIKLKKRGLTGHLPVK